MQQSFKYKYRLASLKGKDYYGVESILLKQQYEEFGEEKIPTYDYAPEALILIAKQLNTFWELKEGN